MFWISLAIIHNIKPCVCVLVVAQLPEFQSNATMLHPYLSKHPMMHIDTGPIVLAAVIAMLCANISVFIIIWFITKSLFESNIECPSLSYGQSIGIQFDWNLLLARTIVRSRSSRWQVAMRVPTLNIEIHIGMYQNHFLMAVFMCHTVVRYLAQNCVLSSHQKAIKTPFKMSSLYYQYYISAAVSSVTEQLL